MPRKAKDEKEKLEEKIAKKETKTTKASKEKVATAKTKKTKKASLVAKEEKEPKKAKSTTKAKTTTKKASATKAKKTTTKTTKKTATKTAKTTKSAVTKSTKAVKSKTTKSKTTKDVPEINTISGEKFEIAEYYDLPYRYNQTVVKLLYQTPTTLFIYWDISKEDSDKFKEIYGEDFFEKTRPVLIVHNETMGYSFEVEINDFANCWYLNIKDSKCNYRIELGRRPFEVTYQGEVTSIKTTQKINTNYIPITSSNTIESPNDHVLLEKSQEMLYFRNVKNNTVTSKKVASLTYLKSIGKIYQINDLYKKFYAEEILNYSKKGFSNPSSGLSSSSFR